MNELDTIKKDLAALTARVAAYKPKPKIGEGK